jgi:hypothetical protein
LEDEIICSIGVPNHVLTDNGGEWATKFDQLCKNYGIDHQYTTLQWVRCNGMAKRLVKILKHGLTILFATSKHVWTWDEHLPSILCGYRCGVQTSTKSSPHMILTDCSPKLQADNFLSPLVGTCNEDDDLEVLVERMIEKMQLISKMHG